MNIHIEFIPNAEQRYETWGDWFYDEKGDLVIKVSNDIPELPTQEHQFLVALHELIEVKLCEKRGITQKMVDDFDMGEVAASVPEDEEPGDHPEAPYRKEHRFAMMIEHLMAHELGLTGYGVIR
jgi:hypothetical protein